MLLTMDVGNTNVKWGVYDGDKPVAFWRVSTKASRTADEYGAMLYDLLRQKGLKFSDVDGAIMCSVAPALNYTLEHMASEFLHTRIFNVDSETKTGITLKYDNPQELGADRIVGAAAAYKFYGGPVIEVDFGSATTFNLVSKDGEFLGGAIAPGIKTATESLVRAAAKLPNIDLALPKRTIGTNTRECMQSGIVFGFTGLVKYMTERFRQVDGMRNAKVVATGGLSALVIEAEPKLIDIVDGALALNGLRYIYTLNFGR